jgi:hypothetical protein
MLQISCGTVPAPVQPFSGMQIFLQDRRTRRFLTAEGTWTDHMREAQSFHSTDEAYRACTVAEAQLVLWFGDPRRTITVQLGPHPPSVSLSDTGEITDHLEEGEG